MKNAIAHELNRERQLVKLWRNKSRAYKDIAELSMVMSQPQGRKSPMYYLVNEDGSRTYLSKEKAELIKDIQKAHMLKKNIKICTENIKGLAELQNTFKPLTPELLCASTPEVYRNQDFALEMLGGNTDIDKWKAELIAKREEYARMRPAFNEFSQHNKEGERVRSKSEVSVTDHLFERGIPYVYESPLWLDGILVWTDITALNVRLNKVLRIEHFGMIDNTQYSENAMAKINLYASNGWVPYDNFLMTFDYGKGQIDMESTGKMLDFYLL